jgi:L-lactate dehydrogenase complex protein LldE
MDQLYPQTGFNMVKVLEKAGCKVLYNTEQTCCGQPAYNAGFHGEAREVCRKFLHDFSGVDYIVTPSASCAGFVRNCYPDLFRDRSVSDEISSIKFRLFEFSEFLVHKLKKDAFNARLDSTATYHDSCAALRECKIKNEPRQLLKNVEGLTLIEMKDVETCCGFGGTFAVKYGAISSGMAEQKISFAVETGAEYIISTDISCLMHIQGYAEKHKLDIKTLHIADVLASGW